VVDVEQDEVFWDEKRAGKKGDDDDGGFGAGRSGAVGGFARGMGGAIQRRAQLDLKHHF
jgi:hypothetical protein